MLEHMKKWNDGSKGPVKMDWIVAAIIIFCATFGFCFVHDFSLTMKQSLIFNDCLFHGKLLRFYTIVNHEALTGGFAGWPSTLLSGANYSLINYASLGLLSLPLYIISHIIHITIPIVVYEFYIKIIYVFMTLFMLKWVNEICELIGFSKAQRRWVVFIFATAPVFLFTSLMITHLDIFSLFFMILGIRALLKKELKKELLFFMLATSFKPFVLLGIIPIILLKEKRILHLLLQFIILCAGMVLQSGIASLDPGYARVKEYMESQYQFFDKFFDFGYKLSRYMYTGRISYFLVAFVLLCVVAYYIKKKDDYLIFALPFLVWCSFVLFVQWNPNWLLLMMPFLAIMTVYTSRFKLFSLISTVFSSMMIIVISFGWETFYDQSMVDGGLISKIFTLSSNQSKGIAKVIDGKLGLPKDLYMTVFSASILCFMLLVIIDIIKRKRGTFIMDEHYERGIIYLSIAPLIAYMLFAVVTLIV